MQAFQVMTTEQRTGPRGGKAKPIVRFYTVTAESRDEALTIFRAEIEAHQLDGCEITVTACGCRVMLCR